MLLEGGLDWRARLLNKSVDDAERHGFHPSRNARPPATSRWPSVCRPCCSASPATTRTRTMPRRTAASGGTRCCRWSAARPRPEPRSMAAWLGPAYGGGLELRPDLDAIEALSSERDDLWKRIGGTTFLTDAEKRAAVGYADEAEDAGEAEDRFFNRLQPREPGGQPTGGRWAGPGGSGPIAGTGIIAPGASLVADRPDKYSVAIEEEDRAGLPDPGHTTTEHVDRTDAQMVARLVAKTHRVLGFLVGPPGIGTFTDVRTANDFVNRVLEMNKTRVDAVASGKKTRDYIEQRFGYITGREAYYPDGNSEPTIRKTYAVCMTIDTSNASPRGYRIVSAFPCNIEPSTPKRFRP